MTFLTVNVELSDAEFICHSKEDEYLVEKKSIDSIELSVSISLSFRFCLTVVFLFRIEYFLALLFIPVSINTLFSQFFIFIVLIMCPSIVISNRRFVY